MIFSNPPTAGTMDWMGCGPEYTWSSWIRLDWVSHLMDLVGLDLAKWTHVQLWSGGFHPNKGNITLLWRFCCTVFFLAHAPRLNRRADSYAEWLKRRASAQWRSFLGSERCVTSYEENIPQKLPKRGVNRQFQAKTPKYLHSSISGTINPTK